MTKIITYLPGIKRRGVGFFCLLLAALTLQGFTNAGKLNLPAYTGQHELSNSSFLTPPVGCTHTSQTVHFTSTDASTAPGYTTKYALTTPTGVIEKIVNVTTFTGVAFGEHKIYAVNYKTSPGVSGLAVGQNITSIVSLDANCAADVSPPLAIKVCCTNTASPVSFSISGNNGGTGYTTVYALTSTAGTIQATSSVTTFPVAASGEYHIYAINYKTAGGLIGLMIGQNISGVAAADPNCQADISAALDLNVCNIQPAISTNSSQPNHTVSYAENGTSSIIDYAATDPDGETEGNGLTWSLSGTDASAFSIDPNTGIITFIAAPNYEVDNSFTITITVTDAEGKTDTQVLNINISDVDEDGDGFTASNGETDDANPCLPNANFGGCDQDNDGLTNDQEIAAGTNPTNPDTDGDGELDGDPDEGTADTDGDGINNALDSETTDTDGDGLANEFDPSDTNPCVPTTNNPACDADGDGYTGGNDPAPNDPCSPDNTVPTCDFDGDGIPNFADPDDDNDGIDDTTDPDDYNACVPDNTVANCDFDGDGLPNSSDPDDDNDGFADANDPADFDQCVPNNTLPLCDFDGDGLPNGSDPDDDNDGTADANDPAIFEPCIPYKTVPACDFDGDGLVNGLDPDDDNDGVLDPSDINDFDPCVPNANGLACPSGDFDGDGLSNGDEVANGSDPSDACSPNACTPHVYVYPKVMLQGAYNANADMMHDKLRQLALIPLVNPYLTMGLYGHTGTEATTVDVFDETGPDAIVDWVLVELRSNADPANIIARRAALLQRDGDVVDMDGFSPVDFEVSSDGYYLAVRHRNHLGVMTAQAVMLGSSPVVVDFSNPATATWGEHGQVLDDGKALLWGGNTNSDDMLIFQGASNDIDPIFFNVLLASGNPTLAMNFIHDGYHNADTNMDGKTIYQGVNNDLDVFIFFNVLTHPDNSLVVISYIAEEQLP